jgi:sugar phosphate isomerase/epimerase
MTRPLPLGAICFAEYEEGFADFVELAASRGLSWIEFKYEPPAREAPGSKDAARIAAALERHGIGASVHLPFDELNIADLDDALLEESVRLQLEGLRFAASIGARRATIHSGSLPAGSYTPEAFAESRRRCLSSIGRVLAAAEGSGIALCLENGNAYTRSALKHAVAPCHMRAIREKLGGRIGYTLDLGHGTYFSRDPSYLVEELGPELVLLSHLHDNSGTADEHRPLGKGVLELEKLVARYLAGGWKFPLSLEHKSVADLMASVDRFDEVLGRMGLAG